MTHELLIQHRGNSREIALHNPKEEWLGSSALAYQGPDQNNITQVIYICCGIGGLGVWPSPYHLLTHQSSPTHTTTWILIYANWYWHRLHFHRLQEVWQAHKSTITISYYWMGNCNLKINVILFLHWIQMRWNCRYPCKTIWNKVYEYIIYNKCCFIGIYSRVGMCFSLYIWSEKDFYGQHSYCLS